MGFPRQEYWSGLPFPSPCPLFFHNAIPLIVLHAQFPVAVMTHGSQPVKLKHLWKMLQLLRSLGRWALLVRAPSPEKNPGARLLLEVDREVPGPLGSSVKGPETARASRPLPRPVCFCTSGSCKMDPGHRHLQWMDEWGRLRSKWWQKPCLPPKEDFSQDADRWGENSFSFLLSP